MPLGGRMASITLLDFYNSAKQLLWCSANVIMEHIYWDKNDEANELAPHVSGYKKIEGEMMNYHIKELEIMQVNGLDSLQQELANHL